LRSVALRRPSKKKEKHMRSILFVVVFALALTPAALADAVYHSSHIPLAPVGSAPLQTGFVENIHPDGPNVFAHEEYVLNGAMPDTAYTITIHVFGSPGCSNSLFNLDTATLTTNASGNGAAYKVFTPADIDGLANSTIYAYWTVTTGGAVAYQTSCQTIQLDS
jgi:hypothetical protein